MSDDLVKRLRNTPNWMREEYAHYKDGLKVYDRAPFEAAYALEAQAAEIARLRAELARLRAELATAKRVAELEGALKDAAASVKEWGAYASQYLQDKWDLSGEVARYIAIAEGKNDATLTGGKDEA